MNESPHWQVVLTRQAEKSLRHLPQSILHRLDRILAGLSQNPTPPDCKKLVGQPDLYRVRIGDWRIIYTIQAQQLVVLVIKIAHRSQVYRDL